VTNIVSSKGIKENQTFWKGIKRRKIYLLFGLNVGEFPPFFGHFPFCVQCATCCFPYPIFKSYKANHSLFLPNSLWYLFSRSFIAFDCLIFFLSLDFHHFLGASSLLTLILLSALALWLLHRDLTAFSQQSNSLTVGCQIDEQFGELGVGVGVPVVDIRQLS